MRWFCLLWLSACGGRTLTDSLDVEAGGSGSGAASSKGGSVGAGGRSATGSGGRSVTPPESCRGFCKELVADCGAELQLNDVLCRSNCEVGFGDSAACDALRAAALGCIQNALAKPMVSCADFSRIISVDCLLPLTLSATCRP